MRDEAVQISLQDVELPDASNGRAVALGDLQGVQVLSLIRHRF